MTVSQLVLNQGQITPQPKPIIAAICTSRCQWRHQRLCPMAQIKGGIKKSKADVRVKKQHPKAKPDRMAKIHCRLGLSAIHQ